MQVREKVGKSRNTVFFQWFVAPEGRKVGSLSGGCGASWPDERWEIARRCGAKHICKWKSQKHLTFRPLLEVEMSKKCTPLWREAPFQVKMYKTPHVRTTFGSWDVEKVHTVVARSTFRSQNVQNTPCSDHFWRLRCRKSACRCGAKHISKSKVQKSDGYGAVLDVQMSFRVAGAKDCAPCQKWAKRGDFVAFPKTMAGVEHFKRICKDAFSMAGAVQDTCSSEMLGGEGADFLRGVAFWSIRSVGLLRWFCVTGAAMKKSRRIVSFLTLLSSKIEEASQNCFVLDVVICCQLSKMKASRRIAAFLTLLSSKIEEVS